MAEDIHHALFPIGPVGVPTESHLFFPMMVFKYTKYPNAAKEYPALHDGEGAVRALAAGGHGYVTQPLKAYESNPIWTVDPKNTPYRDAMKIMTPNGYAGTWATPRPRCDGRLHRRQHGGGSRLGFEDAEGGRRARRAAGSALLQGIEEHFPLPGRQVGQRFEPRRARRASARTTRHRLRAPTTRKPQFPRLHLYVAGRRHCCCCS